jgi:hypothetical protein
MSVTPGERGPRVRESSWRAAGRLGPRDATRAGRRRGLGRGLAGRAQLREKNGPVEKSFSFSFPIFQIHFSNDFQIKFEFDLNHSIQNSKCSSMNAQSCFYPYI